MGFQHIKYPDKLEQDSAERRKNINDLDRIYPDLEHNQKILGFEKYMPVDWTTFILLFRSFIDPMQKFSSIPKYSNISSFVFFQTLFLPRRIQTHFAWFSREQRDDIRFDLLPILQNANRFVLPVVCSYYVFFDSKKQTIIPCLLEASANSASAFTLYNRIAKSKRQILICSLLVQ